MELPLVAFFPIAVSTWEDKMQSKRSDTKAGMRNVSLSKEIGIPCPGSHHWSCVGYAGGWSVFENRFNDYWCFDNCGHDKSLSVCLSVCQELVVVEELESPSFAQPVRLAEPMPPLIATKMLLSRRKPRSKRKSTRFIKSESSPRNQRIMLLYLPLLEESLAW